ncbi:twin-arginine translocase TatA/TatE family subunit [Aquihabitans sp. G128]|uniref:Sec-independent protein translocase subunit TatA/TatB n=1 Tax=Aquihabitans sp. G128 TaxID=2849779 RepID=UPI001C215EE6|nr:twin-arginine translocase TatA/TatE family subunit [Aquihabitans sp. G128]QXC61939.1 twin-arginine translocase TatA/TatE family subunit [Aquihabitans sp. G128]
MFNVGGPEIVVILIIALLVLGPDQLPKAMRTFGNVMAEVRKVSGGFQAEMKKAMDTIEGSGSETAKEKPHSAKPMDASNGTASTMAEADVTEVVARNTDPAPSSEGAAPAVDDVADRPAVDPADRAAG